MEGAKDIDSKAVSLFQLDTRKTRTAYFFLSTLTVLAPVNSVFYWFMAPFLATSMNYDPVAFAANFGIAPAWIVGFIAAIPLCVSVWWMQKATRSMMARTIQDPSYFHWKCLIFYYIISMGFPIISYMNLLDAFKFW